MREISIPTNIKLADPLFHEPGKIDLLLGANMFWDLVSVVQIRTGKSKSVLQKTVLGWVVGGRVSQNLERNPQSPVFCESCDKFRAANRQILVD